MAGQFKTRRNPDTGRIEKILPGDPDATPPLPDGPPPLPEKEHPFIQAFRESDDEGGPPPLPDGPPPLPPAGPPPLPEAEAGTAEETIAGAAKGASVGARFGPAGVAAGAVIGAGASYLMSKSRPSPIGTLEGGTASHQDDSARLLQDLLAVQRKIASVGSPIKDAVTTTAVGSRV